MQADFIVYFLITIRIVAMLMTSPVFSISEIPSFVKIGLSLIIAMLITSYYNINFVPPGNIIELVIYVMKELFIGVSIGYISTLIFNAVMISGQFMDFSMGFSMAQYYDPSTNGNSTPLQGFFNWMALMIFLALNFHHIILSAIMSSFKVIPVGTFTINANIFSVIVDTFSHSFIIAVQLAAPIIIILFITDFIMGLIVRTVPQLNVFILGMPLKVLIGLFAISALLPGLADIYNKAFGNIYSHLMNFFNTFPVIMLMAADDKTEEPTSKKLQDAKKKGQVAKSNELNSAITLLGVMIVFIIFGEKIYTYGLNFMIQCFKFVTSNEITFGYLSNLFLYMLKSGLIIVLPIALTVMILGITGNIIQSGFILSGEGLKPKLEKINPIEGFKRFFSVRTYVELLKSLLKVTVVALVAYSFIKTKLFKILETSDLNYSGIYAFVKSITDSELERITLVLVIIGIADYIFQRRQFKKDLRMTKQEIKEEFKQSEGDPLIKSRIRQKQRQMAMRRMMHEVPKATVVVTNPTHFAVAIKYEGSEASAPKVVAKGVDLIALKIKEIAKDNDVPVIENKPLARALYSRVEIDQEIPVELYQSVAEIIAYVYSMKKM